MVTKCDRHRGPEAAQKPKEMLENRRCVPGLQLGQPGPGKPALCSELHLGHTGGPSKVVNLSTVLFFEPVLGALATAGVRFVVVGGVAVVLHGVLRFTADLDLCIDLTADQPMLAMKTLTDLGMSPVLPVDGLEFADPEVRATWVRERNLMVFSLIDPSDPFRQVDLFAENPMPFEELWDRSVVVDLGHTTARVASIEDLIAMKTLAGRPQDLADVEALTQHRRDSSLE